MTREEFTKAFDQELRLLGVPITPEGARAVVERAWPVIAADPNPARWARAFPHIEGAGSFAVRPTTLKPWAGPYRIPCTRIPTTWRRPSRPTPPFTGARPSSTSPAGSSNCRGRGRS
jgi:hypothetical protein